MTYTATEVLTFIGAFGVLLTSFGAIVVNIIVALRTTAAVKENTAITASISAKADVITGHVNSASSIAASKIDSLESQVKALVRQLAESKEVAAVLAQSHVSQNNIAPAQDLKQDSLKQIETNTAETAANTKKP